MALQVKDLSTSAQKWSTNAGNSSGEYATNAIAAGDRWAAATVAAAQTYQQAVTSGNIGERFRRGVQKSGASKYTSRITEHGASRYSQGVAAAQADWTSGFSPYAQTIAGLTLTPRRPRGDPGNYQRVQQVGQALNARRLALLGSG